MRKKILLILLLLLFGLLFVLCSCNFFGPSNITEVKSVQIQVRYERYIAGGINPMSSSYKPLIEVSWAGGFDSNYLQKVAEDVYQFDYLSVKTETVLTGRVVDGGMADESGYSVCSVYVALYVWINGVLVNRIPACSESTPWAGTFKFMIKNSGEVVMYEK